MAPAETGRRLEGGKYRQKVARGSPPLAMDGVFGVLGEKRQVVRMDGRGFGIEGEKKKSGGKLEGRALEWNGWSVSSAQCPVSSAGGTL